MFHAATLLPLRRRVKQIVSVDEDLLIGQGRKMANFALCY